MKLAKEDRTDLDTRIPDTAGDGFLETAAAVASSVPWSYSPSGVDTDNVMSRRAADFLLSGANPNLILFEDYGNGDIGLLYSRKSVIEKAESTSATDKNRTWIVGWCSVHGIKHVISRML